MKKLFLTIIFCLFASVGYAADFWVYIRTYDKPELTVGGAGRSKKGDIVQVLACQAINDKGQVFNRVPSEKEQKEWLILKVSDIPEDKIRLAMESWQEQTGITADGLPIYTARAYRKYKIPDLDKLKSVLKITVDTGIVPITFTNNKLVIEEKTVLDLARYEKDTKIYLATQKIRKPFEYVLRLLLPFAYAANTTNTVNTDGGGDYLTLSAAEDAIDGTAYGAGETATINCAGTTADTTAVVFAGWDADVGIIVNGDYAVTSGVHYSINYYRLESSGDTFTSNHTNSLTLNKLQISTIGVTNSDRSCIMLSPIRNHTISNCILKFAQPTAQVRGQCIRIADVSSGVNTLNIKNCVMYEANTGRARGVWVDNIQADTVNILNCTVYNFGAGIVLDDTGVEETVNVTNCAIFGNTDDISSAFTGTFNLTYSAGDDADFDAGTGNIAWDDQSTTWDDHFPNYATYDFHLASSSSLINAGTDLFGSGVTTDIDGDTLTVRNDIGADEYVAVGGARRRIFID